MTRLSRLPNTSRAQLPQEACVWSSREAAAARPLFQSRYRYCSVRMCTAGPMPGPPREAIRRAPAAALGCRTYLLPARPRRASCPASRKIALSDRVRKPLGPQRGPAPPAPAAAPRGRAGARTSAAGGAPKSPAARGPPRPTPVSLKTLGSEPLGRRRHWPLRAKPARRASRDTRGSSPAFPRPTLPCAQPLCPP